MATGITPNKLTFSFAEAATFRHDGKKIDLAKAADTLVVKDKDGNDKTITGFKAENGTFFHLKKGADGKQKIQVYGTPEQLAASNLQVRNGDITRARFGDERFVAKDPFQARSFEIKPDMLADRDQFAASYNLRAQTSLTVGSTQKPAEADLTEQLLKDGIEFDRKAGERRMSERLSRPPSEDLRPLGEQTSVARRASFDGRVTAERPIAPRAGLEGGAGLAINQSTTQSTTQVSSSTTDDDLLSRIDAETAPPDGVASSRFATDLSAADNLSAEAFQLPEDARITLDNKALLADQPGLSSYFGPAHPETADLRERLTGLLAARAGRPAPPGSTPLDFLNDGSFTVGQLKQLTEALSLGMGIDEPVRQRPAEVLAQLGRQPVTTLADGNCLFASLAHSFDTGDSMDREAALDQRRELLAAFQQAKPYPEQLRTIAGEGARNVEFVESVLRQGLDGGEVNAEGWGGPESLKLAAMKNNRPIVTITPEGCQVFGTRGEMKRFEPEQLDQLKARYQELDDPVVLTLEGFHWQATEPV